MKTTIDIILNAKKDFYSKYSNNKISEDLVNYIYNECYGENFKNRIIINIYTNLKISDKEKGKMVDIIRRTFGLRAQDEIYYFEKKENIKTILLLVGIALIILYYSSIVSILKEIILILGWLAIWESVYSLLFETNKDKMRINRLKELAKARVYFHTKEE